MTHEERAIKVLQSSLKNPKHKNCPNFKKDTKDLINKLKNNNKR